MKAIRSLVLLAIVGQTDLVRADFVTVEKAPGTTFATGVDLNAIAGGLTAGGFTKSSVTPTSIPETDSLVAVHPSGSPTATASHDFELLSDFSTSPAHFDHMLYGFSHSEVTGQRSTAEAHIEFKVDAPVMYMIDGYFFVDDMDDMGTPGKVELEIDLVDITAGAAHPTPLFASHQTSLATVDEMLMMGDPMAGDDMNFIMGSPVGILDPGKIYAFKFLANTEALPTTTTGATATGAIKITFSAVPEPSGLLLGSLSSVFLLFRRPRRQ